MPPKKSASAGRPSSALSASTLSRAEINEVVEVCIAAPMDGYPGKDDCIWGLPLLIEGLPGIAKTARVKQLAGALQVKARSLFAAQHPPEDFSGALIPYGNGDAKQICPLSQVRELIKEGRGIIFLDEINGAPPATQGALQSFIHERIAGDEVLPGGIRILAASNPEEIATGGMKLSPPLANRFLHIIDPGPNAREWTRWLMGAASVSENMQRSLSIIEEVVKVDWPDIYPEVQGLFAGFFEANPSLLHSMPDVSDPRSSRAWPSPRTWDYATRALTTAKIMEKNEAIQEALVAACVGDAAAEALLKYQKDNELPKPTDVINGTWKPNPDRLDVVLAAFTGAVAYVRQRPARDEKEKLAAPLWKALGTLFDLGLSDIVVPAAEGLVEDRLGWSSKVKPVVDAAKPVLARLSGTGLQKFMEERAVR